MSVHGRDDRQTNHSTPFTRARYRALAEDSAAEDSGRCGHDGCDKDAEVAIDLLRHPPRALCTVHAGNRLEDCPTAREHPLPATIDPEDPITLDRIAEDKHGVLYELSREDGPAEEWYTAENPTDAPCQTSVVDLEDYR